jgi:ADP-heptose:LPS heptosyltransferase
LHDPGFRWAASDTVSSTRRTIVVQTHLEGLPSKVWSVSHWERVVAFLQRERPGADIRILDPSGAALAATGAQIENSLTFPQAVHLVENCCFLLSVDSWSKYVAAWKRIPQLVLVPDQTADYPQLTASSVWRHSFRGVRTAAGFSALGLAPLPCGKAEYTFGPMARLTPEAVMEALRKGALVSAASA